MLSNTMHEAAQALQTEGVQKPGPNAQTAEFNPAAYLPMLAEFDLTDEHAHEILAVVWNIMRACVEMGIRRDVCGELGLDALPVLSNDPASLDSKDHPS